MWNYRVGTSINKEWAKNPFTTNKGREFFIFECYYNEQGIPDSYFQRVDEYEKPNPLSGWEDYENLKGTYELIKGAFDKPVIDIDNFPSIYISE